MNLFILRSFIFFNFHLIVYCRLRSNTWVIIYVFMILIACLACKINKWIEYEDTWIGDVVTQIRNKSNQELKPEDPVQLRYSFNMTQFQHIVLAITATFVIVGVSTWSYGVLAWSYCFSYCFSYNYYSLSAWIFCRPLIRF